MQTEDVTEHWINEFKARNAFWYWADFPENPKRPHVELTTGNKHSNGFANCDLVVQDVDLLMKIAFFMARKFERLDYDAFKSVNRFFGPAMGAPKIAFAFACHVKNLCGGRPPILANHTLKIDDASGRRMVVDRTVINPGDVAVVIEDVITSGTSASLSCDALVAAGAEVVPYLFALVNRSGETHAGGRQIVPLIDRYMPRWDPEECPLCKLGSKAIRPKGAEAWASLNAEY